KIERVDQSSNSAREFIQAEFERTDIVKVVKNPPQRRGKPDVLMEDCLSQVMILSRVLLTKLLSCRKLRMPVRENLPP
ncbi:hypothetical protein OS493_039261, partial [Desmophyllum pertusum]